MSGRVCEIIIRGNFTQSYARSMTAAAGRLSEAQDAIATAQALCSLGTTSYDGKEVMTDDQQTQATVIMGAFNDLAGPFVAGLHNRIMSTPQCVQATQMLVNFNQQGATLLAAVLANP